MPYSRQITELVTHIMIKNNRLAWTVAALIWTLVIVGVISLHSASASNIPSIPSPEKKPPVPGRYQCMNGDILGAGKASWYGPGFHGRKTANGEKFNMNALTAAHRRLPLGTIIRVENPANGEYQIVRINDRGPYIKGRMIDLSYRAAKDLGFDDKGITKVVMKKCS